MPTIMVIVYSTVAASGFGIQLPGTELRAERFAHYNPLIGEQNLFSRSLNTNLE